MSTIFDDLELEEEPEEESVAIVYDIASYPSDFTLAGIAQMWEDKDIEIPDFQREFVWSIRQSSLLIDSFLCGLPVPPVFFYIDKENKNLVIDGQQRIMSVVYYLKGYFGEESTRGKQQVFRLTGLSMKSPYFDRRFEDLKDADQRKLKQSVLRAVNIRQLNPTDEGSSAYHIFERLNTGGTPLKPQEIRNSVYRGQLARMLKDANRDKNWRKILGKPNLDKHQKDVEVLLRLFALAGAADKYEKPMKEYLNNTMRRHAAGNDKKVEIFFSVFPKVVAFAADALGPKPFNLRGPLNASALDAVLTVLLEQPNALSSEKLRKRFAALIANPVFQKLTLFATTDTQTVQGRIKLAREILLG